jgi:hypothetical protein
MALGREGVVIRRAPLAPGVSSPTYVRGQLSDPEEGHSRTDRRHPRSGGTIESR